LSSGVVLPATSGWSPCDVGIDVGCGPWDSSNRGVRVCAGRASGSSLRVTSEFVSGVAPGTRRTGASRSAWGAHRVRRCVCVGVRIGCGPWGSSGRGVSARGGASDSSLRARSELVSGVASDTSGRGVRARGASDSSLRVTSEFVSGAWESSSRGDRVRGGRRVVFVLRVRPSSYGVWPWESSSRGVVFVAACASDSSLRVTSEVASGVAGDSAGRGARAEGRVGSSLRVASEFVLVWHRTRRAEAVFAGSWTRGAFLVERRLVVVARGRRRGVGG
jgi:hypothetical protein